MRPILAATVLAAALEASFFAFGAHAESACPELARAEAAVLVAQAKRFEAFDPAEGDAADLLVAAALEQLRTARDLCGPKPAPVQDTMYDAADPWQADAEPPVQAPIPPSLAEAAAVLGVEPTEAAIADALAGLVLPAEPFAD